MTVKLTWFLHDGKGGFSESFYVNGVTLEAFDPTPLDVYIDARMGIAGAQTAWDYLRINQTVPPLQKKVRVYVPGDDPFGLSPVTGKFATNVEGPLKNSDFSGTSLLVRKIAADFSFARIFLRGIPDDVVDEGGQYKPYGLWNRAWEAYVRAVKVMNFGWESATVPVANSPAPITNMVMGTDGIVTITAGSPIFAGLAVGSSLVVRVSKQRTPANINGTLTVYVKDASNVVTARPIAILPFIQGAGVIGYKTSQFIRINDLEIEGVTERKPGRPFGLYHGRQRNRVRG